MKRSEKIYHKLAIVFWILYYIVVTYSPGMALGLYFIKNYFSVCGYAMFIGVIIIIFNGIYLFHHCDLIDNALKHIDALKEGSNNEK